MLMTQIKMSVMTLSILRTRLYQCIAKKNLLTSMIVLTLAAHIIYLHPYLRINRRAVLIEVRPIRHLNKNQLNLSNTSWPLVMWDFLIPRIILGRNFKVRNKHYLLKKLWERQIHRVSLPHWIQDYQIITLLNLLESSQEAEMKI